MLPPQVGQTQRAIILANLAWGSVDILSVLRKRTTDCVILKRFGHEPIYIDSTASASCRR